MLRIPGMPLLPGTLFRDVSNLFAIFALYTLLFLILVTCSLYRSIKCTIRNRKR